MASREIVKNVFAVGTINWDLRYFDAIMPTPHGSSNNAYLVRGSEKTAIVDLGEPNDEADFITNLMRLDQHSLDYIICLHAEQDHSGLLPLMLEIYPMAKVVTNETCRGLLFEMHNLEGYEERFITIANGEILSLGDKTLKFYLAPWIHWPDTMFVEIVEDRVLFTSDFFGAHYASETLFQDDNSPDYLEAAKRYYSALMMPFRASVVKYIDLVKKLNPEYIGPAHGPVLRMPTEIIDLYADWASDKPKNKVVIGYVSMHGNTKQMVNFLVDDLLQRGVPVNQYNLLDTDTGVFGSAIVDAATIILATPTVLHGPHPAVVNASYLIRTLRPKAKYVGIIGSFGWESNAVPYLQDMMSTLGAENLNSVYIKGIPDEETIKNLHVLAETVAELHQTL